MRRSPPAALLLWTAVIIGCQPAASDRSVREVLAERVRRHHLAQLDTLHHDLGRLDSLALSGAPESALQPAFHAARRSYKHAEFLVEYFTPAAAKQLNGPAIDAVEPDDPNRVIRPAQGFQVVEELTFPTVALDAHSEIHAQAGLMQATIQRVRSLTDAAVFVDGHIVDALRLELGRVSTLGLAGFDSPVARAGDRELADALDGVRHVAAWYSAASPRASKAGAALLAQLDGAIAGVRATAEPEKFDRLDFLAGRLQPVLQDLQALVQVLDIGLPARRRAWRAETASLFEVDAFDPAFFAALDAPVVTSARIGLGRRLFFDPVLSGGRLRACATCHQPQRAFTDGLPRAHPLPIAGRGAGGLLQAGPPGDGTGADLRNTPTVINAGLQSGSFYDLRTAFLEDQVGSVIASPAEMHGSLEATAEVLDGDPAYRRLFMEAFPRPQQRAIAAVEIRQALAAYIRSLTSLNSRFDRYLRGERSVMNADERQGFIVFMGKARCGTCHFPPLFNGTVPPEYTHSDIEVLGVPARAGVRPATVDPDPGRERVHENPLHRHGFRTSTLRNIALTAPYMHNGVYRTLEQVVDFYDGGGGAGLGINLANQTLPTDSLHLTPAEKRALVAFMQALTDTVTAAE